MPRCCFHSIKMFFFDHAFNISKQIARYRTIIIKELRSALHRCMYYDSISLASSRWHYINQFRNASDHRWVIKCRSSRGDGFHAYCGRDDKYFMSHDHPKISEIDLKAIAQDWTWRDWSFPDWHPSFSEDPDLFRKTGLLAQTMRYVVKKIC